MRLARTPSQTVGPFLAIGLPWADGPFVVPEGTPGSIWIRGRVTDGTGSVVPDALIETWQADPNGRFAPSYDDGDVETISADACILAIGQRADLDFLKPADGIELTPAGAVRVDPETLATSAPGIFAGGDVAFGPRNLIEAVANGKRAARSIQALSPAGRYQRRRPGARALARLP